MAQHPDRRGSSPWQQLAQEGMSTEQIFEKLGIPDADEGCIGVQRGSPRVSLDKTQSNNLVPSERAVNSKKVPAGH